MNKWFLWFGMLLLSGLLAACSPAAPAAATVTVMGLPSATARASSPTPDLRPTATLAPTATKIPTVAPTKAVDYCVTCHTDKDTLVKNLKAADAKPKESEGAG